MDKSESQKDYFIIDFLALHKEIAQKNIKIKEFKNPKNSEKPKGSELEIILGIPEQITTEDESKTVISRLKQYIGTLAELDCKYKEAFDKCTLYLDFRNTEHIEEEFAEELMKFRLCISRGYGEYHSLDFKILKSFFGKISSTLRKAQKKILAVEIEKTKDPLRKLPKSHAGEIDEPDLRLPPFSQHNLIPKEVYNKESKHHELQGYIRDEL